MKMPLLIFALISASPAAMCAEIIPYDTKTPLFQLYEVELLPHQGPDPHTHQMKAGKLFLSVHTLRDLRLLPDGSGVQAALNEKDTRTFAQLTHTHDYIILLCGDEQSSVVMHITAPIDDGVITFTDANFSTHVGGYLLRRCPKSSNQSMKPTAPLRNKFSVFATTPCRGLSLSR